MKKTKHIWKYLTNGTYRSYVDLQMTQQALDAHMDIMTKNIMRSYIASPVLDLMTEYGVQQIEAEKLIMADRGIS